MNSEEGKIFVGGIPRDVTASTMYKYFSEYGRITRIVIPVDVNGCSRGFGFVSYSDPTVLDEVLEEEHVIGDTLVEVKRAWSREQYFASRTGNPNFSQEGYKIFVRGLPSTLDEEVVGQYFKNFGRVTNVVFKYDEDNRRRGFGFIYFDSEAAVKRALRNKVHNINGELVHVKHALPRHANPGNDGGGYQPYGTSSVNAGGAFDSQVAYVQPQTPAVGYPYSGYSDPDYIYGNAYGGYVQPQTPAVGYPYSGYSDPDYINGNAYGGYVQPQTPAVGYPYSVYSAPDYGYGNAYGGYGPDGYGNASVGSYGNYGYPGGPWRPDPPQIAQPRPNQQP